MSVLLVVTLAGLGVLGGFSAGLLGFGGGVLMFPLLYYVPPLVGLAPLDAKTVAAIVVSQVFFSTLIGGLVHLRGGRVQGRMAIHAGIYSALGAFAGGIASQWTSEQFLLVLFGIVALLVTFMMFLPAPTKIQEEVSPEKLVVRIAPLFFFSLMAGVVIGFLGAGNFVFVPLLIYVLKVPTRIAIGSSLIIATINTASGFVAKLVTGQIPAAAAIIVVMGAALGALAGEQLHRRLSIQTLRIVYTAMVALIALRIWLTILGVDA
jgi:uncharacterized membrane protein YfcA